MRRRPIARLALFMLALFAAGACEKDRTPPPVETCTRIAEQCKLPEGPLGVCNSVDCRPGQQPPCLRCVSQH